MSELWWDSESRKSPFSTVADPEDETCEVCGETPTYSGPSDKYGTCGCDSVAVVSYAPVPTKIVKIVAGVGHVAGCGDVAGGTLPLHCVKTTGDLLALGAVPAPCLTLVNTCTCGDDPYDDGSLDCPDHGEYLEASLAGEAAAEIAAENAWLHAAENAGYNDGTDGVWT